ncbi:UNVERIFIED_CONTAM: hypothetical protein PYX00_011408 [Menopon gallinae]|uniref:RNA polymerase III subunit RPC82-related helix-turn-helix domain-containing protein n=1 Tax=Menopon gallinae TaxID=328185 RepID=A0AAW2H7B2_9NEOP
MREEAESSTGAAVFDEYGAVTRKVAEHLLRHSHSSLSQVACATRLSHADVSAAISLLLHIRCATYARAKGGKIFYSATVHEKRLFFATYCDFVAKCLGRTHGDVFRRILVGGITNTSRIQSAESLELLAARGFVSVGSRGEVRSALLERDTGFRDAVQDGRASGAGRADAKRTKLCRDGETYAYVNYAEVEKRIFDCCFCVYLDNRYNGTMAALFLRILRLRCVAACDLPVDAGTYVEYLVADRVVESLPSGDVRLGRGWRDALKRDVLSRFLENSEGKALRRIFNTILRRGTVPDKEIARAAMVGAAQTRCLMLRLQQTGCAGVFANFVPSAFYSKANLSWRVDWARSAPKFGAAKKSPSMSVYAMEKLESICTAAAEGAKRKQETLEVQVCLKGYDLKRDKKFDGSVVLPFQKRKNERVLVVGDKKLEEMAADAGLPFVSFDEVTGKTKDKKTMKKKLAAKHHAIITTSAFHKHFEIFFFNRKRTPFYIFDANGGDLKKFYEEVARTVKFKLRQTNVVSFPAGTLDMSTAEISQNVQAGLEFLFTLLKKGAQNVDTIFLKTPMEIDIYDVEGLAIADEAGTALYHVTFSDFCPAALYRSAVQAQDEISIIDERLVLLHRLDEISVILYARDNRNEILLSRALEGFSAALQKVLKKCTKLYVLKKYDLVCLLVREFVFNGVICERNTDALVKSVPVRSFEGLETMNIPQGFLSFFADPKGSLKRRSG